MVSGATQNNAKQAVATKAENKRRVADLLEQAPPMQDPTKYNSGLGPAHKQAEAATPAPITKLGQTEIEWGKDRFHRPAITVHHAARNKALYVTLYACGRTGKQANFYQISLKRLDGDRIEIQSNGAAKSEISLAEWQAFVDQVDVRVSDVSKNTVEHTPELVKMARDLKAFRRAKAPTDQEWAVEMEAASLKRSLQDVKEGRVHPIDELWDFDCYPAVLNARAEWLSRMPLTAKAAAPATISDAEQARIKELFKPVAKVEAKPDPAVLPQQFQSPADALPKELSPYKQKRSEKTDDIYEAVRFAIEHPDNADAQNLPDGLLLSPAASGDTWVKLTHPAVAKPIIVGMRDLRTGKLECVTTRGEILDFVKKIASAQASAKRAPALPEPKAKDYSLFRKYAVSGKEITEFYDAVKDALENPKSGEVPAFPFGLQLVKEPTEWLVTHPGLKDRWPVAYRPTPTAPLEMDITRGEVNLILIRIKEYDDTHKASASGVTPIGAVVADMKAQVEKARSEAGVTEAVTKPVTVADVKRDAPENMREVSGELVVGL